MAGDWWYKNRHAGSGELVLQGNVEVRQVNLGFKVPGRIEVLNVDEGDRVRAGEVLASLEKIYFQEMLAQMRAQLDQAEANYTKLKTGNRPEEIAQAKALVAEREATLTNAKIIKNRAEALLKTPAGRRRPLTMHPPASARPTPSSIPPAKRCGFKRSGSARRT